MPNANRIAKAISDVLETSSEIQKILSAGKEAFLSDKKYSLALKYLLIEAVEAITDVCQHLLAKAKGAACNGYVDCIVKAGEHGIVKADLANKLRRLADLRNSLIHRYWIINDDELFTQCSANIGDFEQFVSQIKAFLADAATDKPVR